MAIPDVSVTVQDGKLGIAPANSNQTQLKIGVSMLGLANTIYPLSDVSTTATTLGKGGPLAEATALALATQVNSGLAVQGGPVYAVPVNPSVAGTVSAVTKVGTGSETLTVTVKNAVAMKVKVTTGGDVATARVAYSFDGGATYGADVLTAATLVVAGNTLTTLSFTGGTSGAFVVGDVWSIATTGTATLTGTGTGTVAVSAASPVDSYTGKVTLLTGGALGTATFNYSLDNGRTFSPTLLVPSGGVYVVPDTGLIFTFSGTSTAGDYFTFTTTAAGYSTSDMNAALTAVLADPREWAFLHLVGQASSSAGAATMTAAVQTQLETAASQYRFARGIVELPVDTDSGILSAFASTNATRVNVAAGTAYVTSVLNGRIQARSAGWVVAARAAKVAPSEDLGRIASGSLGGVVALVRDENATQGLDAAYFSTLRSIIGRTGYFITTGRLRGGPGSDFVYWQNGRVMDIACKAARDALLTFLNDSVRVNKTTGYILEADARGIENYVGSAVRAQTTQPGYASAIDFKVLRNVNILSTSTLPTELTIVPLGYARAITLLIGFSNPALTITQAAA